jgi:hypothetical protein
MTADMTFTYTGTATPGTEANYKPQRVTAGVATSFADACPPPASCVDQTNDFIFAPGVSTFNGNWTASDFTAAPTAAMVSVSGRVTTSDGTALRGARITLDDGTGHRLTAISNAFGYYRFDSVASGSTVLVSASSRGYTFTPRVVTVSDAIADLDITALP